MLDKLYEIEQGDYMSFKSILYNNLKIQKDISHKAPFIKDLNLDQLIDAITSDKEKYNLESFFYKPLYDVETIYYRQEVMRDLENATLMSFIKAFTENMNIVFEYLSMAEKLEYEYNKKGWFLEAILEYCDLVTEFLENLNKVDLHSRGLQSFLKYLAKYVNSDEFKLLKSEAQQVKVGLEKVRYCIIIKSGKFTVRKCEGEEGYSEEIERVFSKFRQGGAKNYLVDFLKKTGMNHIEAKILDFVRYLFAKPFAELDRFLSKYEQFIDNTIRNFYYEIQFYVAYLDFISHIKEKGLSFCYPKVSKSDREEFVKGSFDLTLAYVMLPTQNTVVCNDYYLNNFERIIIVTGPNQGGKTTFARMFGQLHYLASLGCPVPGLETKLFLPDKIFTHFEREEDIRNLHGKLEYDLVRIYEILEYATPNSILILNEIFSSTTLKDALFLSKKIMERIVELGAFCVWVTFIDELCRLSDKIVSMACTVDPQNPTNRTFKVIRKSADGLAYAISIAKKYNLTYDQIKERIKL